jgi:hypothetical protein
MANVLIEVRDGGACFSVAVRAESIRRAVDTLGRRYPGCDVRVNFPIDPERFFVKNPTVRAAIAKIERPTKKMRREADTKAKVGLSDRR